MPRWKALPRELDPAVGEFTERLRGLVDRSRLSVAAVADRTGYSKTSWERYLDGRLLPPRRAVVALAEATGTDPGHLVMRWEPAERAWSRAELRHDVRREAIRAAPAWAVREAAAAPGAVRTQVAQLPARDEERRDEHGAEWSAGADGPGRAAAVAPGPSPGPGAPADRRARRLRALMLAVGALGALLMALAAVLLLAPGR
ncbi:helix-turn-helix domain-containing protein [Streptomyces sp. NRRL S-337]|uniref:helix-turn-helix domain-containing protein n=1 Tax=Streptomyces sp. NRRL S-337 TaxID=1463900 RepID=UPI00068DB462|nr:helix-turn-helix transcriptional regulator [Streptomyces sp. NRRL S-337]